MNTAAVAVPGKSLACIPAVRSLARHLIGRYSVPSFLAASWYAMDDAYAEKKREWFVAHARGASFRSLDGLVVSPPASGTTCVFFQSEMKTRS